MATHADSTERRREPLPTVGDDHQTDVVDTGGDPTVGAKPPALQRRSRIILEAGVLFLIVAAVAGVACWQGYRFYQARAAKQQRELFLQVASQGAVNLTTISYAEADTDVQRILDSSTGTFHDDFQKRAQPFIDVVRKVQSTSQGAVTAAALESEGGDQASALVTVLVSVKTSTSGAPQPEPRAWRMRITVQKAGASAKVSNVEFVP